MFAYSATVRTKNIENVEQFSRRGNLFERETPRSRARTTSRCPGGEIAFRTPSEKCGKNGFFDVNFLYIYTRWFDIRRVWYSLVLSAIFRRLGQRRFRAIISYHDNNNRLISIVMLRYIACWERERERETETERAYIPPRLINSILSVALYEAWPILV